MIQLGTPIELLTNPTNNFVSKLVGADNTLRQLQYLPVAAALDNRPETVSSAHWGDGDACSSDATLLDAMLQLLSSKAPSLAILDSHTHDPLGSVTLASINRELHATRAQIDQKAADQAESRI